MRKPASRVSGAAPALKGAAKSYGSYRSLAAFERGVLQDPGFAAFVLRPDHVRVVARRLGPLAEESDVHPHALSFSGRQRYARQVMNKAMSGCLCKPSPV